MPMLNYERRKQRNLSRSQKTRRIVFVMILILLAIKILIVRGGLFR